MSRIPEAFVSDLKAKIDLVALGERHGIHWDRSAAKAPKACCPFHAEKTPSFVAHQDGKHGPIFHCYGCARTWDALAFVQALAGVDFVAAVEELASTAGIAVPRENETPEQRGLREKEASLRGQAGQALSAAQDFFISVLQARTAEAKAARDYLVGRDLPCDGGDPFGFGYAPRRGGALVEKLDRQGITREAAALAGLLNDEGRPRFWGRVTLPIRDRRGQVLSFAGRVLDGSEPKYLNGPETPFFEKGKVLYGLDLAADAIRERGRALLVEGHLDRVTAHLCGLEHAVALQGTAFTPHHAAELARLTPTVVFALDGDDAGLNALERALPVALEAGLSPRFVGLPAGEDPDGWLRKGGARG
ncbi:MAG: DNA primase [Deferrisomatales bacterium]